MTQRRQSRSSTVAARPAGGPGGARSAAAATPSHRDHSACACGGSCPRCAAGTLQRKAQLTTPGDALEREADAAADQVLRATPDGGSAPRLSPASTTGAASSVDEAPELDAAVQAAGRGGSALPASLRAYFEPRFARDLGRVRVHSDAQAARAASGVQARAYTTGSDIVFGAGEYRPDSEAGRRLIAHELAHTVQQDATRGAQLARTPEDIAEAERQAAEEKKQGQWNWAYGRDPSKQYGAERGTIDEDVTYTGKDKKQHTRHQPALEAASKATGPNGEHGTPMDMTKTISDQDVEDVMMDPNYGDDDRKQIKKAAIGAGAQVTEAFQVMQIDTLEAQSLYLAHAAVESRGLRSMIAQADPGAVGQFPGRGPLQVTFQQNYIKTLAYLDEQAKRLDAQGKAEDAEKARAASAAIKADPAKAADRQYAFLFSAAMMHAAGGVRASAEMSGKSANFGGTGPEDRWETGGDNFDERIAYWTAQQAAGNAAADERLKYWRGVKLAGQRKTKAYNRALDVLKKNVLQATPAASQAPVSAPAAVSP